MAKTQVYRDLLGAELAVGDPVALANGSRLALGKIIKFSPKMVGICYLSDYRSSYSRLKYKYSTDLVKLQGEEVTMYLLKHST